MGVIRFTVDPEKQKGQTFITDDYIYRTDPEWKLVLDNLPEGRIEIFFGSRPDMDEMKIARRYYSDVEIPRDYISRESSIYADIIWFAPGADSGEDIVKLLLPVIQ